MFIPLNGNVYPVSIYLWASWLDFFMVHGEWQACWMADPSHPKGRGSEIRRMNPAAEVPVSFHWL